MRNLAGLVGLCLAMAPLSQASAAATDPWDAHDAAAVPHESDGYPWGLLGLLGLVGLLPKRRRQGS